MFTDLSRFAEAMVPNELQRARKFEGGLRDDIKGRVNTFRLATFLEVLDVALIAEKGLVGSTPSHQVKR